MQQDQEGPSIASENIIYSEEPSVNKSKKQSAGAKQLQNSIDGAIGVFD